MSKGLFRGVLAALFLAVVVGLSGCIPGSPKDRAEWNLPFPPASKSAGGATTPYVVIAGDSLVQSIVEPLVGRISQNVGLGAFAQGVPSASYSHYINPGLMVGTNGSRIGQTIGELSANPLLSSTRQLFVIALGTNDARILSKEAGTTQGYTVAEMEGSVNSAIQQAQQRASCVLLVNAAVRQFAGGGPNYIVTSQQVNQHLAKKAGENPQVRIIDWQSRSVGHPDWFNANDIHHSAAGMEQYLQAIVEGVQAAKDSGC